MPRGESAWTGGFALVEKKLTWKPVSSGATYAQCAFTDTVRLAATAAAESQNDLCSPLGGQCSFTSSTLSQIGKVVRQKPGRLNLAPFAVGTVPSARLEVVCMCPVMSDTPLETRAVLPFRRWLPVQWLYNCIMQNGSTAAEWSWQVIQMVR
jgi:hypothetical protein